MKKALSLLLSLTLLLSLAACGQPAESQGPAEEPDASAEQSTPITTPPQDEAEDSQDSEALEPSDDVPEEDTQAPPSSQEEAEQSPQAGQTPSQQEPPQASSQQEPQTPPAASTPAPSVPSPAEPEEDGPKILIAYFTWADNTVVEDPSAVDADATTSASVLVPGNAARLAGWIQQEVGGDLHSIIVEEPYSSDYDECLDRAADEKADNARPALTSHVDNMEEYDIVFLGFPNWWYTLPMPVLTFVDEYDWSGKTVVPFVTHGTGGLSSTIRDLTAALPEDVTILDAIGVYRPEVAGAQGDIIAWLDTLNLEL